MHANGGTIDGKRLLETAGFTKLGERKNNRVIYELAIENAQLQILKLYQEAFKKYQEAKSEAGEYPESEK